MRTRSIIGICLCALMVSAIAAQAASAADGKGTTAFTCKAVTPTGGTEGFSDAHCKSAVATNASFEHFAIANDTTTELSGTNVKTGAEKSTTSLHSVISGVELELQATDVSGSGSMHNHEPSAGNHEATGTGTITYTGVTVTKPTGERCRVRTDANPEKPTEGELGVVHTNLLKAHTTQMGLKFEPNEGEVFASFWIEQNPGKPICPAAFIQTWKVVGSIETSNIEGATSNFTRAQTTEQGTLHFAGPTGPKAGIDGTLTLSGRANSGQAYTPLAATTTDKKNP